MAQLSHPYMTTGKTIALTTQTPVSKVMSLYFNMLSRFVIPFHPKSKSFNLMTAVTICSDFGPRKIKSVSIVSPSICHEVMALDAMIFVFWMLSFRPAYSPSSFTFIKRVFSSSSLSVIRVVSEVIDIFAYLRLLIFLPAILIPGCASSSPAFFVIYSACKISKVTICNLHILLSQFGTSLWFHVQF